MTQDDVDRPRKRQRAGEEGAACTRWIVNEVKRRRAGLDWSAERLAAEMSAAGVPWTRDVVVNLENGRRKTIAVHELLALAWILDISDPVELLVPQDDQSELATFPVTPGILVRPDIVRAWFKGETGPLRASLEKRAAEAETEAEYEESIRRAVAIGYAAEALPSGAMTQEELVRRILDGLREGRGGKLVPPLVTYLLPAQTEEADDGGL